MSTESSPLLPKPEMPDASSASPHPAEAQLRSAVSVETEDQAEAAVIHRAAEVIGDRSDAMRWLGTPVRALNYATPISLLHESKGREAVLSILGRLEHGIL
jgi:putative toxin-antitoxin system antitoxin component (TIGR02293 family)